MTYNIFTKAQEILKNREKYFSEEAHSTQSHIVKQCALSEAGAYNSAWWILQYAIEENWEALEQFDYYSKGENA